MVETPTSKLTPSPCASCKSSRVAKRRLLSPGFASGERVGGNKVAGSEVGGSIGTDIGAGVGVAGPQATTSMIATISHTHRRDRVRIFLLVVQPFTAAKSL